MNGHCPACHARYVYWFPLLAGVCPNRRCALYVRRPDEEEDR